MDALLFRYLATAGGFLYAWAAVLADAVSFWRFRSSGRRRSKPTTHAPPLPSPRLKPVTASAQVWNQLQTPPCGGDNGGDLKGRFMAYFDGEELVGDVDDAAEPAPAPARKSRRREGLVLRGSGDLGWYRYQDVSVINGSVVRLWDSERRWTAPAPAPSPVPVLDVWRGRTGS